MDQNPAMKLAVAIASLVGIWIAVYWLWEPSAASRPPISFADESGSVVGRPSPGGKPESAPQDGGASFKPVPRDPGPRPGPAASAGERPENPPPRDRAADRPTGDGQASQSRPESLSDRPAVRAPKFEEYKIQPGDDFQKIAARRYGSAALWTAIARSNPFVDPHRLRPGRVILLPVDPGNIQGRPETSIAALGEGWKTHKVREGDTLTGISRQYYGTIGLSRRIYEANTDRLKNENDLKLGLELLIPPPAEEKKPGRQPATMTEAPR